MNRVQVLKGNLADFSTLLKSGPMADRPFVEAFTTASEVEDSEASYFPEFLDDFRAETVAIVDKIRASVGELTTLKRIDQPQLAEAYRVCHMLKGSAATMGFNRLSYVAHGLERIFEDLKEKRLQLTPDVIALLGQAFLLLEKVIAGMKPA